MCSGAISSVTEFLRLLKRDYSKVKPVEGRMLSNNFLRKKKDGSQRVILNLKFLNETIDKYNLKISPEYQTFFRFVFMGKCMKFWLCRKGFEIPHVSLPNFSNQLCRVSGV